MEISEPWRTLVGQVVVLDLQSPFVCIGRLMAEANGFVSLEQVDVHDLRDTTLTRDRYVLNCLQHGVRPNRSKTWINVREIVGVSRLEDVLAD